MEDFPTRCTDPPLDGFDCPTASTPPQRPEIGAPEATFISPFNCFSAEREFYATAPFTLPYGVGLIFARNGTSRRVAFAD